MTDERSQELLDAFGAAYDRFRDLQDDLDPITLETVETIDDALITFDRLFDTFEDRATGSGDFAGYITFQQKVASLVSGLPDDLPERDAFEAVEAIAQQRRLSEADFEDAREALEPARAIVETRNDLFAAREALHERRLDLHERLDDLDDRIEELDRVLELGEVDIEKSVADIRDPIETFNDAVTEDFHTYLGETPAPDVIEFIRKTRSFPLVHVPQPPTDLRRYLTATETDLTIYELQEYANYSRSKLEHYIHDPGRFKTEIATEQTYLASIDAEPFHIEWPPLPANELRWKIRELLPLVDRFGSESTVAALRSVRDLIIHPDRYHELRDVAVARNELTEAQREKLAAGAVEPERDAYAYAKQRISKTLDETPEV